MKNIVMISILALTGSAFAAGNTYVQGGSSAGLSIVTGGQANFGFGADVAIGAEKVFGDFGVRGNLGLGFGSNSARFGFGADLLYPFAGSDVKPYVGAGFGARFGSNGYTSNFDLHGILGADFKFTPTASIFAELEPSMYFAGGSSAFNLGIGAGLKVYF